MKKYICYILYTELKVIDNHWCQINARFARNIQVSLPYVQGYKQSSFE